MRAGAGVLAGLALLAGVAGGGRAGPRDPAPDARVDYMLQCQGCHLADGTGRPGAVPSLVDGLGRFLATPAGRAFLVRVPGSATSPLDDARLAGVLNWMVRSFDPAAARRHPPYTASEVGPLRRAPLSDVAATRRALLGERDRAR